MQIEDYMYRVGCCAVCKEKISKIGIEKFDGFDFSFWKMQIEDYLY